MKTATEWLCEQWLYLDSEFDMMLIDKKIYWEKLKELQAKAKQMEREQIIEAAKYGNSFEQGDLICEVYYNETYGKDKSED
jgi:hypothetical protein